MSVAVKVQAAVQAEHADTTALTALVFLFCQQRIFALLIKGQVIVGLQILDLRLDIAPAPIQWQANGRFDMQALAIGTRQTFDDGVVPGLFNYAIFIDEVAFAQAAVEAHIFRAITEVNACGFKWQHAIQRKLRQAVVRGDVGDIGQLVCVRIQACGVTVSAVSQCAALIDVTRGAYAKVSVEILEVVRVADVGVINFGQ